MGQAKDSLLYALGRLKAGDRFNVIRFDDTMDMLFADTVPADAESVGRAQALRLRSRSQWRYRDAAAAEGGPDRPARGRPRPSFGR